jgi:integrase
MLRAIEGYQGPPETIAALKILYLTGTRVDKELGSMEWSEIDFEKAVWTVPAEKLGKTKKPLHVPLAPQAIDILKYVKSLNNKGSYVFCSRTSSEKHISENTANQALRALGITGEEHCAYGFRTSMSSMLNNSGLWHKDAVERQLSHKDKDENHNHKKRASFVRSEKPDNSKYYSVEDHGENLYSSSDERGKKHSERRPAENIIADLFPTEFVDYVFSSYTRVVYVNVAFKSS